MREKISLLIQKFKFFNFDLINIFYKCKALRITRIISYVSRLRSLMHKIIKDDILESYQLIW